MFATLELPLKDDSRHKRLQGGRACHPCRVKKIKCDGKQPCMQCKARRRKCTFVKAGDDSYIRLDAMDTSAASSPSASPQIASSPAAPVSSHSPPPPPPLSSRTNQWIEQLTDELTRLTVQPAAAQAPSTSASSLASPWANFGGCVRWSSEPASSLSSFSTWPMPSRPVQLKLVGLFYTHCPHLSAVLPRHLFYHQTDTNGPLITPFLLCTMFAHAAQHDNELAAQSHAFYVAARQMVDEFIDAPRISTVLGLFFLAFYDDDSAGSTTTRQWMYSGMAARMVVALGLYSPNYTSHEMSLSDVELRKRVVWTAFIMDRLASTLMERPPTLTSDMIHGIAWPCPLPEETAQDERRVIHAFAQLCQLMLILENIAAFFSQNHTKHSSHPPSGTSIHSGIGINDGPTTANGTPSHAYSHSRPFSHQQSRVMGFLNDLKYWRHRLDDLAWLGDLQNDVQLLSSTRHHHWTVRLLHLIAFDLELSLLMLILGDDPPYASPSESRFVYVIQALAHMIAWTKQQQQADQPHQLPPSLLSFSALLCTSALLWRYGDASSGAAPPAGMQQHVQHLFHQCLRHVEQSVASGTTQAIDKQRFAYLVDTVLAANVSNVSNVSNSSNATLQPSLSSSSSMDTSLADATTAVISATGVMHDVHDDTDDFMHGHALASHHAPPRQHSHAYRLPSSSFVPPARRHHPVPISSAPSTPSPMAVPPFYFPAVRTPQQQQPLHHAQQQQQQPFIEPADYTFELISVADEWARMTFPTPTSHTSPSSASRPPSHS
ncbi:fungal-specific transcription factor domain-containing protein [Gongronella butleri]|nr:fungal-specific transcription factor domain-containing protein [Gongronella butleri]